MLIVIDTLDPSPIYEQLRDQVILGIAGGKLIPGEALPSVRRLAADLGINFHTVNKSYTQLSDEGYIVMDRRRGAVVAQSMKSGEEFKARLMQKLHLLAAEAICHNMSEDEFAALCAQCYQKAGDGGI